MAGESGLKIVLLWILLVWGCWAFLHLCLIGIFFYFRCVPLIEAVEKQVHSGGIEEADATDKDVVKEFLEDIDEAYFSSAVRSWGGAFVALIQVVFSICGLISSKREKANAKRNSRRRSQERERKTSHQQEGE